MDTYLNLLNPQNIANAIFILVFIVYWVFTFIVCYHLIRFGIGTVPKMLAIIFLVGSIFLFSTCVMFFTAIDTNSLQNQLNSLTDVRP